MAEEPSPEFWAAEAAILAEVMRPWMEKAAKQGALEAQKLLGDIALDLAIDWDLINDWARAWSITNTSKVVASITTTSMDAFVAAFPEWVESGEPLNALIAELSSSYEPWRARMIAITETTRAYTNGNHTYWGNTGIVSGTKWFTGEDDLVCPICEPLAGQEVSLGGTYEGGIESPPAHVACRCYEQPIVVETA